MDEFAVSEERGFLPRHDPLEALPQTFSALELLLQDLPITKRDGSRGILATPGLIEQRSREVPQYDLQPYREDSRLMVALFRDYCFWASAYCLEPCHHEYLKSGTYGLARDVLPSNIAVPLCWLAERIQAKPWLEYAHAYALANYARVGGAGDYSVGNMRLVRQFEGSPDEAGFVLVHVAMDAQTGPLVRGIASAIGATGPGLAAALRSINGTMQGVHAAMESMWSSSRPTAYQSFRTFIMGIKGQPMFPRGLTYEGTAHANCFFRGESGANDSIIPSLDNLLGLRFPDNPLTAILADFRSYRPLLHAAFVNSVPSVRDKVAGEDALFEYALLVESVRVFRARHWNFVREYILKFSRHPVATGGSPIGTWLPNQLRSTCEAVVDACGSYLRAVQDAPDCGRGERVAAVERIQGQAAEQLAALPAQ